MKTNFMVLDTETTNDIECPLVYDLGYIIFDENKNILLRRSFVVTEMFYSNLMEYAYFKDKIPMYLADIENGSRIALNLYGIRQMFCKDIADYNVKVVMAHNALFDYRALQNTTRWLTKSKYRYFFPKGIVFYDTLKMARQTFAKNLVYNYFCKKNGYLTPRKQSKLTAEVIHRFMTNKLDFMESHTGLEDCEIEKDIYFKCLKMNARIDCRLFA